jgi:hypothetical protein
LIASASHPFGYLVEVEAGRALRRLRDGKLYRSTHPNFASYVKDRFGFERQQALSQLENTLTSKSPSESLESFQDKVLTLTISEPKLMVKPSTNCTIEFY